MHTNSNCTMNSRSERGSLSKRRSSAQFLTSLTIPPRDDLHPVMPVMNDTRNCNMAAQNEVVEEGEALFREFLLEEINNESSVDEDLVGLVEEEFQRPAQNNRNPFFIHTGRQLRQMADEFARTRERQVIRHRANQVGGNITSEQFRELLSQLFYGGVTAERIVVLFYFCSDVARNALGSGRDIFQRFLQWSLQFIAENVCQWVQSNGGWGHVLMSQFNSVYKLGVLASFCFACVLIVRHFR